MSVFSRFRVSISRVRLLVLLLLLFTLLFSVFLAHAQGAFTTLVSNVGETDDGEVLVGDFDGGNGTDVRKIAQAFTTGNFPFHLKEIRLKIGSTVNFRYGGNFEPELMTSDGVQDGSRPQSRFCPIFNDINSNSLSINSEFVYTVPDSKACTLAANTEYFLVFQIKEESSSRFNLVTVSSDTESGESGWGMADNCLTADVRNIQYGAAGTWSACADGKSVKLGLSGVLSPAVLLKNASDTGASNADNITSDDTPEFDLSGFTSGATVTVTATHDTEDNVVLTRSGDGDVIFTTLAEGDWTITATDTTNTATITITVDTTTPSISVPAFAGHLGPSDTHITKADSEASPENLIATPTSSDSGGVLTATYAVISSSATCDNGQTFTSGIPQTDDVATDGIYKVCIKVADVAGNTQYLSTSTFTRDIAVPVVSGIQDIGTTSNPTPDLTFTTSEDGFIRANSNCGITRQALTTGANTITLSTLSPATYPSCTFIVEDAAGNPSAAAQMNPFIITHPPIVTNVGQTDASATVSITSSSSQAQQFTTPADPYALTTIGFEIDTVTTDPGDVTVTLQGASGGEPDGVAIASVDVSGAGTTGTKTADFSSENVTLKPSTDYFIVFSVSTGDIALQLTASDAEDASSVSGASIGNTLLTYSGSAWTSNTNSVEITVNGSTTHLYLKNTSDTGPSPLDHYTLDYTPTVVITGMTGTVSLTATATSETDVTATRNGDGDVTIPALARNKEWTITATDSSVPAKTATLVIYVGNLLVGNFTIGATSAKFVPNRARSTLAQSFTTTDSYALESVRFRFDYFDYPNGVSSTTNTFTVSVQGVDGNGYPDGTSLVSVTDIPYSSILTDNVETITFPKPVILSANTQYTIAFTHVGNEDVFENDSPSIYTYTGNGSSDEDSLVAHLTGWTLADTLSVSDSIDPDYHSSRVARISLQGSRIPAWTVDLHTDSDTGDSNTDDITDDDTPDITVAGFDSSDVITVRATKTGESAVTATRTGNGDVTLGTLAPGDWRISASNALGDTTLHITVTILNTTTVALKADSNSGSTADLITNVNTPTIVVSGFGSTASVTVTADHTSAPDVTTTITGNGDALLGTLADGDWIITASDGSKTTDPITITIDATVPSISVPAFAGHLGTSDGYITKADSEAAAQNLIAAPNLSDGGSALTATYAVISSSATCNSGQTFTSGIPQTSDVTTDSSYKICIKVVDMAANTQYLSTSAFTRDIVVPTISGVSSIGNTYDSTPDLTFTTSEAGVLRAVAGCGIRQTNVSQGQNTITLATLTPNTYPSCTLTMEDSAGNPSIATSIPSFTIQAGGISITALSTAPAQSRQATATVTGTNPSDLNWVLFAPGTETCNNSLTFSNSYISGTAVTIATTEADNTKRACFRATVAGTTIYQSTDVITGIDTTAPALSFTYGTQKAADSNYTTFTSATSTVYFKTGDKFRFTDTSTDGGSGIDASTRDFVLTIGTTEEHNANNAATLSPATTHPNTIYTVSAGDNGILNYTFDASDEAGNAGTTLTTTFTNLFVDTTAPTQPTIDLNAASDTGSSDSDNITNDDTPTFTITNDTARVKGPGGVTIDEDNGKTAEVIAWYLSAAGGDSRTEQSGETANTFTPSALSDGTYKLSAKFIDKAGNEAESTVLTFVIDTAVPAAPTTLDLDSADDTGRSNSDNITSTTTGLTITTAAAGENGGTVQLYNGSSTIGSATTISAGTTSTDIDLAEGTHTITAKTTDVAGNQSSASTALSITVDSSVPTLALTAQTKKGSGGSFADIASSNIYLKVGDGFRLNDSSDYSIAGVDSTSTSFDLDLGTTEQHTAVTASDITATTTASRLTYTISAGDNGIFKYTFDATDEAGNAGTTLTNTLTTVFVDTTAPTTPTIDLNTASDHGISNSDNITNDDTPTFSITNDSARVKGTDGVAIDEDNGKTAEVIAWYLSAAGSNTRDLQTGETANTFTPSALSDGTYKLSAKFIDKAGNETESTVLTFVIDTAVPSAPTTLDLAAADDTGRSNSDNITNTTTGLTITTAAAGENGGTVQLYNGSSTIGSATTISAGTTSTDIDLAEGTHSITAKTTDVAGNQSSASTALSITVDTTPPAQPVAPDLTAATDSGFSDSDDITNLTTLSFDLTFSNAPNDLGMYGFRYPEDTDTAKGAGCTTDINGRTPFVISGSTVTRDDNRLTWNRHLCVYFIQVDLAGNSVASEVLELVYDRTAPSLSAVTWNLPNTDDTTRAEIAADGEDDPNDDGDSVWNPGKTDDYTKEDHFNLVFSNVPSDQHFGARQQVRARVRYTPVDTSGILLAAEDSATAEFDTIPSGATGSVTLTIPDTDNKRVKSTGTTQHEAHTTNFQLFVTDVAGNTAQTTTSFASVMVDTVSQTPPTPDLVAASDTGASDSDNYTNANLINLDITFPASGVPASNDEDSIINLYTWIDGNTDTVIDASELTIVSADDDGDFSTDDRAPHAPLTNNTSNRAKVTFENVHLATEGTHTLVAGLKDKAGNPEAYSTPLTIYIDRTAPDTPEAPTLNSQDDSGAIRPGAGVTEQNLYRTDHITNIDTNLSFFGCVDISDVRSTGKTDEATLTAIVRDSDNTIITDTSTPNTGTSGSSVTFGDPLQTRDGDPVRPTNCPTADTQPYTLDLDETYGATDEHHTYTITLTATDLAGNISAEGDTTTFIIDQKAPTDALGSLDMDSATDNGEDTTDNATSLTDILYTTNKHSIDNNGATAYQTRTQQTLSHYEIALQEYSGGRTQGAIFTAPSSEQITYFQGENIPEQPLNGATFPERDRQGTTGIALILKGLNLTFEQYATIFQTRIRAVDVAGNVRELFPTFSASYLLPPPPITDIDLATASDSGSGVSGTTTDDITALNSWTITGSFVYRERDDSALVSQIYARVLKDSAVITSTTITNITDGSIEGLCSDEEATCQESDDVASTFSHTFDLSTNNLTDGDYTIELKTYNGADFGPVNTDLTVTYDTTPPDTSLLTDLALYANHPNGQPALHWIGLQKPRKSAVRVYAPEGTTPLDENTEDDDDISIRSGNNPYIRSGDIRSALDYEITLTDAAGNESERITLPPRPDISIVSLGTSKYAAVALLHEDASRTSFKSLETTGTGACTIPNDILSSGTAYTAYTDGTALTLSGNSRFCFYVAQTHDGITTHFIQDTQGAPSFAAVTVHQDDDTTISQYATTNDAYTSETSPRLTGSTLPNTPVRLYRVTRAQFTAATTNDEWTELAIDDNKILDTTSDEDMGTFSVPAPDTPLTEGEYLIAAQISLDGGTSYTDTAQVFTLHIDTTAPTAQATAPTLTTSTDDTGTSQSDGITKTTTLAFTTAALTTGEDLLTCYLNNTPADTSYQSNTCTITAPEGVHTITTTVTDRAGNESPHTTPYNLTIDTTNPAITLIRLNDADTTIDANTRFIAVAADQTTTEFSYVIETKAACDARTTFGSTTYTAGTQFDPDDSASDGYCFIARDLADNLSTLHTEDSIEGVGSFSIQGGTKESSTIYTTSGTKTITGVTAPEAKVLIKITEATDDPSTYSSSQLQDTSFATITFDTAVGETTFTEAMRISPTDDTKKVVGWIWTDKDDHTTATPAITLATLTVDDQAPIITPGTITSNNVDPSFAKQGDIITATFTTSETIQTHTASINGVTAACADANNTFTCTATLTNEATEGSAKLTTTITDKAGNTTTRTITETMVTIDATAPTATITNLQRQHLAADDSLTFTLTITDTNEIKPGTYTFTATGATLSTCTITVPADSNRASTDCTITTASGADGTPIILTIPTLTDGPGNTKASTTTTLGHVDTAAPTIDSIDSIDDTKRKKFTFTITATHNQHASNTNPETLTPTFSGDCERFDADTTWTGTGTTTYTTTLSVSKGTYKTCAITLTDEAGNQSTSETFDEFMIKGSGGAALLDAGRSLISSIFGGGSDSGEVLSFIEPLQQTPENTQTTEPQFTRDLTIGSTGDDVRALQQLLNDLGFLIADTGPGSPGQESTYFGERTRQALIRYQQANNISPASGYFGPLTRASLQNQPTQQVQSFIQQTPPNDVPPTETTPTPQLENIQTTEPQFTRDLTIGSTGDDVRALQQLLNDLGFLIADTGPGSPGQESTYFGERTRQALIRYQQANSISPASGYFGPLTRSSLQNQPTQQVQSFIQQTPPNDVPPTETTPTPQPENTQDYEPITDILYKVRQPSFDGAPSF